MVYFAVGSPRSFTGKQGLDVIPLVRESQLHSSSGIAQSP